MSGTGYVVADAVMAMPATVAVADNSDPASSVVGTWSSSTSVAGYYGSDYRTHDPASNSDRFSWKLALPTAGAYNLYARWTSASKRASDAPYTITHASGSSTVKVDQRSNNSWMPLGTYTFNGTEANVKLGVSGTGYVIADAVMAVSSAPATVAATATATSGGGTQVHYVYADHVNTPRVITRASDNKMVWRWDNADAFGMVQPNENPSNLGAFTYNPRFPGQVYDKESNLHYNTFRDYDPATSRYVQSDPIGLAGGINTYAYVTNQPTRFTDPRGLDNPGMGAYSVDVSVYLYAGNPFGHVGIAVNGGPSFGYYGLGVNSLDALISRSFRARVLPDAAQQPGGAIASVVIPTR